MNSDSLMSSAHLVVVPCMSSSCCWNPGSLAPEPSWSYEFIVTVQGILLYQSRESWDSVFVVTHSKQYYCFSPLCTVLHFQRYFVPLACLWLQGTATPSSPTLCDGACSELSLPAYVSGPQSIFPEGDLIGPAGQVPRVNPDTPGQSSRRGVEGREPTVSQS